MKHPLREAMRARRSALSDALVKEASQRVCARIRALHHWQAARHIALYLPVNGEIDPRALMNDPLPSQQFYLPCITREKMLHFLPFTKDTSLRPNRYGIPEPLQTEEHACSAPELNLVIVPLVAFDATCQRLGMGAGFYDRTFANPATRPLLLGLAHDFQRVEVLDTNPWDVPLNGVITPETCYWRTA